MRRLSSIVGFMLVALLSLRAMADAPSEQSKTIPLDEIWGYNLPGTRDISGVTLPEIDRKQVGQTYEILRREREKNIEQIRRILMMKPPTEKALSGFVMPRQTDFYALRAASSWVGSTIRGENTSQMFRAGDDMLLTFFSHPSSYYVRLKKVELQDSQITVHYQFEPHATAEVSVHFALIPLGKLPVGEYQVYFKQQRMERKYKDAGFEPVDPEALTIISRPFSFTIWEPSAADDELPAKDATLIPLDQIWGYELPGTRDIRELEPQPDIHDPSFREYFLNSLVHQISAHLSTYVPKEDEMAGPAFVVVGTGKEALKNAQAMFIQNKLKQPEKWMPRDTELSLVFYTYTTGWHPRIKSVEQSPRLITVKYQFIDSRSGFGAKRFALIPIGKFSKGAIQVNIKQLPPADSKGKPVIPKPDAERFVCDSFSFDVR